MVKHPYTSNPTGYVEHVLFEGKRFSFPVGEGEADHFVEDFGGQKVRVDIPVNSVDELTEPP